MPTRNRLDLQTLGYPPVMPKNLPDHWVRHEAVEFEKQSIEVQDYRKITYYFIGNLYYLEYNSN